MIICMIITSYPNATKPICYIVLDTGPFATVKISPEMQQFYPKYVEHFAK